MNDEDIGERFSGGDTERADSSPIETMSTTDHGNKRKYSKTIVSIPVAQRPKKRRKVSKNSAGEYGNSGMNLETDDVDNDHVDDDSDDENDAVNFEGETNELIYLENEKVTNVEGNKALDLVAHELESDIGMNSYDIDQNNVDNVTDPGEVLEENMQSWDVINENVENIDKDVIKASDNDKVVNEPVEISEDMSIKAKRQICVKVQLHGTQMKALSKVGSKGGVVEQQNVNHKVDKG